MNYGGIALQQLAAGNLSLFDGNPKTNQCHINALLIGLLYRKLKREGRLSQDDEKFLILCFFTNFKARTRNERKQFISRFLPQDTNSNEYIALFNNNSLKKIAPQQLACMLFNFINNIGAEMGYPPLDESTCILNHGDPGPTYPKFLGAQIFLNAVKTNNIPVLLKVSLKDQPNPLMHLFVDGQRSLEPHEPIVVIDASATGNPDEVAGLLDSFTTLDAFMLPCAAYFTATCQAIFIETVMKENDQFYKALEQFQTYFVPLGLDIRHVYPACSDEILGKSL